MKLTVGTVELQIDALTPLFILLFAFAGRGMETAVWVASLTAHELGHLLAARAVRVPVRRLRLTPFGGFMEIDDLYAVPAWSLSAVALAGPLANLMLVPLAAALCYWRVLNPGAAATVVNSNLLLTGFNLLPIFPLDGGRIAFSLLAARFSRRSAFRVTKACGIALGSMLLGWTVFGFAVAKVPNLSAAVAAIFILTSLRQEERSLSDSAAKRLLSSMTRISVPVRADIIAAESNTPAAELLRAMRPGRQTVFALYENGSLLRFSDARHLIEGKKMEAPPQ